MHNATAEEFKALLSTPQNVVITTHYKPDADALGSSLALSAFLQKLNHTVTVITPSDYPSFLNWIDGQDKVLIYNSVNETVINEKIANADIIFCLDFSALSRINEMEPLVAASKAKKVLIDHHLNPESFADYNLHNNQAAATAELIYDFIHLLDKQELLDKNIAESIYAGIVTDTGSFRFPTTTSKVHRIIAHLLELGADNFKIHSLIYDSNSELRVKFLGFALSQKLTILHEFNTAFFTITASELEDYHSQTGDTEGLVNYGLSIENIKFAAVLIEREDGVKISFRSIGDFAANEFAATHFEGGGHKNASGGKSKLSLDESVKKFISLLPIYKESLTN